MGRHGALCVAGAKLSYLRLPAMLERALHFIPTYYFVEALRLSLAGNSSGRFWGHLAVVLASTAVAFAAAIWALRRQQN